jgi:hypothetical protein
MARKDEKGGATANGRPTATDLEAIEREHVEQLARAHAALAEAQDRSYWLDRWGVDLNTLMRRPSARRLRALLRWLRELQRGKIAVERYARARRSDLSETAVEDDLAVDMESRRGAGEPARPADGGSPAPRG